MITRTFAVVRQKDSLYLVPVLERLKLYVGEERLNMVNRKKRRRREIAKEGGDRETSNMSREMWIG